MGILSPGREDLFVSDVVLVKQSVSTMHVELDMTWWADKQVELFEHHGVEPWQCSVWVHTHPSGMKEPSTTDTKTMEESFGSWPLAVMLILTKDNQFYGRVDFTHVFPGGASARFGMTCKVEIAWDEVASVSDEEMAHWEAEFQELVTQEEKPARKKKEEEPGEEVESYVTTCELHGLNPDEPESFEAIYGYWPDQDEFWPSV